jgi:D-glycero-D-manno-heptose 1,7-bisphosphate phosphatase
MAFVILDRDGVINFDSENYIKSPEEWRPIPGSLEAIARLCRANFQVVLATNQSGIGRGLFNVDTLNRIHQKMITQVQEKGGKIDAIFFCPHIPEDHCLCRKPKPGLLLEASKRLRLPLDGIPFVGDSNTDAEAALAVGAQPILVKSGHGGATQATRIVQKQKPTSEHVPVYSDLAAFVAALLDRRANPQAG